MKRRMLLAPMVLILLTSLVIGGCQAPAPTPSPTPMPVEPIKLKFAHPIPPMSVFHREIFVPWVEKIKERTTAIGKPVEITIYPAESLAKHRDSYKSVVKGIADIAMWGPLELPGKFPVAEVMGFAFLFPSATVASLVARCPRLVRLLPVLPYPLASGFHW